MITSKYQWSKAKEEIDGLKEKMASGRYRSKRTLERFEKELGRLEGEVDEFETLQAAGPEGLSIKRPQDVLLLPMRYRIAKKMTLEEFSEMVGVGARLIWRYENDGYTTAKGHTLNRILSKLPVDIETEVREL